MAKGSSQQELSISHPFQVQQWVTNVEWKTKYTEFKETVSTGFHRL